MHDSAERSDTHGGDGKEPRQHDDPGRVSTFDAKVGEVGKDAEALCRRIQALESGQVAAISPYVYAWQQHVAEFYGIRLRRNFEFGRRFTKVGGIADLVGLQHEYVRDTLLDYASGFCEMVSFGLHGARQTTEHLNRSE